MLSNMLSHKAQMGVDALKVSPAAAVVGTHIAGVNWPDVAYILTTIYTSILVVQHLVKLVIKLRKKYKHKD